VTPLATVEPIASFSSLHAFVFVLAFFSGAAPVASLIDLRFFGAALSVKVPEVYLPQYPFALVRMRQPLLHPPSELDG
jgi:hypothetical protein